MSIEPRVDDADREMLDFVHNSCLSHENWCLWWGLGGQNLTDRSRDAMPTMVEMQQEHEYAMQRKPWLERAPKP